MKSFSIISLGCSRNLVDSEVIAGALKKRGFAARSDSREVDLCIVNTCAFIEAARKESVDAIMEIAGLKKAGKVKKLVVCGCLPQLYKGKLFKSLPEADLILGTADFPKIGRFIDILGSKRRSRVSARPSYLYDEKSPRHSLTPHHYAYIKVSEGCANLCSYCIIPRIRGRFRSRSIGSVAKEVQAIAGRYDLKEIILIGQDTTLFGMDRYGRKELPELLRILCGLKNSVEWLRIMYTHPAHYSDDLIDVISGQDRICRYLDMPIQHISDTVLKRMNRHTTKKDLVSLIEKLRKRIPGLSLRTSMIVGFPGETDKEFKELLSFVRETRFNRLGAFTYCREAGTKAGRFARQVPERIKQERLDELMKLQQDISLSMNRSFIGKSLKVLIDEKEAGKEGLFIGRTEADSPEVDGVVYVSGKNVPVGKFCDVKITDSMEYDLIGCLAKDSRTLPGPKAEMAK